LSRKLSAKIVNVVATASLNQRLDIESILRFSPSADYRPALFPGLIYRLKRPKTATLIFSVGKMICTGARSEEQAKRAIFKVIQELKENGVFIVEMPEVQIVNIVASIDLGGYIDLEESAESLERIIYEPEQFPGLIYRMDKPKVVMLLFSSGKVVCVGARKGEDAATAGVVLQSILESKNLISYE
jgi:transcription initiation factor TFIID TATA-box-binding protein